MIAGGGILVKSHSILAFSAQKLGTDLIFQQPVKYAA
jgi:hypothetical protein